MQLVSNPEAAFLRLHQPQQDNASCLELFEAGGLDIAGGTIFED
jgi:hypothetical protein